MPAADEQERLDALPRGAALGAYTVEDVLGHGGFGIVYRARHNELGNLVAVKEYLPAELALRKGASVHPRSAACRAGYEDGLRRFRDEARALIEFQAHPSIVSCRDFFRANGTAYLVMEYEQGLPLSELLRRREASGRPFDEADLLAVMVPLLEGLRRVHEAGMLHRDIKPGNILVRRSDERPVLIDFGAAKQGVAEHSKSMAPYTEGYAAWEQVGEGKLGPWTDVYAVGAVMWRIVAGGNPPWEPPHPVKVEKRANAAMRGEADPMPSARELGAGRFSPGVLEAIDRCLKLNEKERVRDCGELLGVLRGAESAEPAKQEPGPERREASVAAASTAAAQARSGKRQRALLTAAGVALVSVLAWFAFASWDGASRSSLEAAALAQAEAAWNEVREGQEIEELRAYIEEYREVEGAGEWVGQAESLLEELDREEQEREAQEREAAAVREAQIRAQEQEQEQEAVREAQARVQGQEREAVRRREESRAAWESLRGTQSESVLTAYITQWEREAEAAAFVDEARDLLDDLVKIRKARETAARAEAQWNEIREARDAEAARAYIEKYGGVEGAGAWVNLAESLLQELDKDAREAAQKMQEAREAWEKVKGTQSESVLTAYIAQWERKAEAREFMAAARVRLDALARVRRANEVAEELKRRGSRFQDCAECPQMVVIPAGSFLMGSPESEEEREDDEGPQHRVTIREPFAVGAYEVTFEEWDACAAEGGCGSYLQDDMGWGRGRRPAINVSSGDAQEYVRWLSRKTGEEYRLLSEAEWEYAARAGTTTRYSFGDEITPSDANYGENIGKTQRVGSYRANGFGLYDVHGNAREWVQDCWNGSYAGSPNNGDAWEVGNCSVRVLRGGSWLINSGYLRSADRGWGLFVYRNDSLGFRVARTLAP